MIAPKPVIVQNRVLPSCPQFDIIESRQQINLFLAGQGCFAGDTPVRTSTGYKKISEVDIGDQVYSLNESTGRIELKPVINKMMYLQDRKRQNIIIFKLTNGLQIKCTPNHEFYFKGNWVSAGRLARRVMESCLGNQRQVLCEQLRKVNDYELEELREAEDHEASVRWEWLFANNDRSDRQQISYYQNASNCGTRMGAEPAQQGRKFGVVHYSTECDSWVSSRQHKTGRSNRRKQHNGKAYETASFGNKIIAWGDQSKQISQTVCSKPGRNIRHLVKKNVVASEINLQEIVSFEIKRLDQPVFDLTVADNHNYCITEQNVIVHNSGKTFIAGIVSARYILKFPRCHGFIGANTYTQLSDSTLFRIREVWKRYFNWSEYSRDNPRGNYIVDKQPPPHFDTTDHNYDSYHGKICFIDGTVIYKGSLDNYKAHEGKEFAWAILDETKDTKEEAVKEVITGRLREHGMYVNERGELVNGDDIAHNAAEGIAEHYTPWNPLYILTSPAKVQWINEWFKLDDFVNDIVESIYAEGDYFIKDVDNKRVTISSVYHNRKNLPSNFISNQLLNLNSGQQDILIYGNPFSSSGGEFYKCFNRVRNVIDVRTVEFINEVTGQPEIFNDVSKKRAYNPNLALHISFDFNVNPYITCTIYQIVNKKKIYQIDEICLESPLNRTADVCKEFIRRYQGHESGLFVYGDPSGKNEDTKTEKGENNYLIIIRALAQFKPTQRVAEKAPSVTMRGNFLNTIFEKGYEEIEMFIHNTCVKSYSDYVYLKEASDGTKLKEKVKHPDTGVTYEKYGHCFVGETMIQTDSGEKRIDQIRIGDMVLTRAGYRPVERIWDNGYKKVEKYIIDGREIVCTSNHKFLSKEQGFTEIGQLIVPTTFTIFDKVSQSICEKKLSIITGSDLRDTQTAKEQVIENITLDGLKKKGNGEKYGSTNTFGLLKIKRRFQRAITYTMQTKTSIITNPSILFAYLEKSISAITVRQPQPNLKSKEQILYLQKQFQRQELGIAQRKEELGIANMRWSQLMVKRKNIFVQNVEKHLNQNQKEQNIVQGNAEKGLQLECSGENVRQVYDITVRGEHEYFANGVLAHNCSDAGDYFICFAFAPEYARYMRGGGKGIPASTGKTHSQKNTY